MFTTEESFTLAYQMLQQYTDRLSLLILPDEVNRLGSVLCTTVSKDPNILKVFASVLLKSEGTVQVAKDILKEYGKYYYIVLFSFSLS